MTEPLASRESLEAPRARSGLVVAGTYRLLGRLGSGGMGDVYEAEHMRLGSLVAIKFLRLNALAEPRAIDRFRREAKRLATLRSDHIVSVFDCGEMDDGTPYLVMERLFGEDLRRLLEHSGPLPIRRAVKIALDACRGVGVVHAAGLVHRDLKPANLFIVQRADASELCKILDFGVAKSAASEATHALPGSLRGTLRYMAPEQLENSAEAQAPADIYALGAILYECLTGVPAHRGETMQEIMFDILHRDPVPPSEFQRIPEELEAIVLSALSRRAGDRMKDVKELERALLPFGPHSETGAAERSHEMTLTDSIDTTRTPRFSLPFWRQRRTRRLTLGVAFGAGVATAWVAHRIELPAASAERSPAPAMLSSASASPAPDPVPAATAPPPPSAPKALESTVAPAAAFAASASARSSRNAAPRTAGAPRSPVTLFDEKNPYTE
jgi:eukaryotic-like serine/threonine-protein kinase